MKHAHLITGTITLLTKDGTRREFRLDEYFEETNNNAQEVLRLKLKEIRNEVKETLAETN